MERTEFSPEAVSRHPAARIPCSGALLADRSAVRSAHPSVRRAGRGSGAMPMLLGILSAGLMALAPPLVKQASAQSAVPALPGPSLTRVPGYDPGFLNDAVVRIEAKVPGDAESS